MNNKQITKEAHDAIAEKYYELYKDDVSDLKYFDLFLSDCELKILDLGCGMGHYSNYMYNKGLVDKNYFAMIKNPKREKSLPKFVKDIDIDKMFMIPDIRNPIGQRNLLVIRMLYATGVRIGELINIRLGDINKYNF